MNKNYLYIYLARLDKKGIKIISGFKYLNKVYPTRVTNINNLNLNKQILDKVSSEFFENRMKYDLWIETAESFNELKNSLEKRGYSQLPMQQFTGYVPPTTINDKELITKKNTMTRRNSDIR